MAAEVFISYRNEDQAAATRLCEALEQKGLACWIAPRNIPGGREWPAAIVEAATQCRALVVILSSHSVASRQVGRELETADHAGGRILTFRIENVEPPPALAYFLGNVQWVDAFDGRFDEAVDQLARAVQDINCPPPAPTPATLTTKKRPNYTLIGGAAALAVVAVIGGVLIARPRTIPPPAPDPAPSGQQTSSADDKEYLKRAQDELAHNHVPDALSDINKAIALNPKWAFAYLVRGRVYAKSGRYDLAIPDFTYCADHGNAANAKLAAKERDAAQQKLASAHNP